MTAKFYLRDKNAKGLTSISLYFQYNNNRFVYPTKQKIKPSNWNFSKCRSKSSYAGATELTTLLEKIENLVKEGYRKGLIANKTITNEYLRAYLNEHSTINSKANSFFNSLDEFIAINKITKQPNTIKKYHTLKKHLLNFERSKRKSLTFDTINLTFYDAFLSYLLDDLKHVNNTASKYITTLKTFMTWTLERDYHNNTEYQKFSAKEKSADITYLTDEQLTFLNNLKIENPSLALVKDYFCLACFTGMRFSEIEEVEKGLLRTDSLFLTAKKTKEKREIPLNDYAKQLLEKYDYNIKIYTNATTNRLLKKIGRLANFNEEVILKKYRGADTIEIRKPLSEHLTFHLARRTFITLSLEKGIRPEVLMEIVGQKDYKTMKKYIKITQTVKKTEVNKAWGKTEKPKRIIKEDLSDDVPRTFSDWLKSKK
jgi:integrase